jgi:hypothetical protein
VRRRPGRASPFYRGLEGGGCVGASWPASMTQLEGTGYYSQGRGRGCDCGQLMRG